jgi:hypothetical protein
MDSASYYYKVAPSFCHRITNWNYVVEQGSGGIGRVGGFVIAFSFYAWLCWFRYRTYTQISAPHPKKTTRSGKCVKTMPQIPLLVASKMQNFFDFLHWVLLSLMLPMTQLLWILFSLTLSFLSLTFSNLCHQGRRRPCLSYL